ncbi:GyrI-like domain-containing protein [Nonomuraea spiralis]|uniref:GyrI-like domain-containing protein n=1 Tax=Nonomuraea spiralis TaxID=46182 RepID=A0ABV5IWW4_9ACTN|nr:MULTISPECIES: GyrI-like domain-containing protein [Nonomuraea]GGS90507.1 transcriptional regulator [Nonomuraea spiralis]
MTPRLVHCAPVTCLNVTGMGEPGGPEHVSAIRALYTVASAMGGPAGPLEGRWWVEDSSLPPLETPRDLWRWHLLLPLPGVPEPGTAEAARERVRASGAAVDRVQVVTFTEGECVELLHEGPFSEEKASLEVMEAYMAEHGLTRTGLHHEIYLTDPTDPEPRTILRQPVTRPAGELPREG